MGRLVQTGGLFKSALHELFGVLHVPLLSFSLSQRRVCCSLNSAAVCDVQVVMPIYSAAASNSANLANGSAVYQKSLP